jgi:hypothetical protein
MKKPVDSIRINIALNLAVQGLCAADLHSKHEYLEKILKTLVTDEEYKEIQRMNGWNEPSIFG